jgi:late competence protein required for DNA uptake (superfamily II DNA/RNA helicase)
MGKTIKKNVSWERVDICRNCGKSMKINDEEVLEKRTKRIYYCARCKKFERVYFENNLYFERVWF